MSKGKPSTPKVHQASPAPTPDVVAIVGARALSVREAGEGTTSPGVLAFDVAMLRLLLRGGKFVPWHRAAQGRARRAAVAASCLHARILAARNGMWDNSSAQSPALSRHQAFSCYLVARCRRCVLQSVFLFRL